MINPLPCTTQVVNGTNGSYGPSTTTKYTFTSNGGKGLTVPYAAAKRYYKIQGRTYGETVFPDVICVPSTTYTPDTAQPAAIIMSVVDPDSPWTNGEPTLLLSRKKLDTPPPVAHNAEGVPYWDWGSAHWTIVEVYAYPFMALDLDGPVSTLTSAGKDMYGVPYLIEVTDPGIPSWALLKPIKWLNSMYSDNNYGFPERALITDQAPTLNRAIKVPYPIRWSSPKHYFTPGGIGGAVPVDPVAAENACMFWGYGTYWAPVTFSSSGGHLQVTYTTSVNGWGGTIARFYTSGTLPTGVEPETDYTLTDINHTDDSNGFSTTVTAKVSAIGTGLINFTNAGTGVHSIHTSSGGPGTSYPVICDANGNICRLADIIPSGSDAPSGGTPRESYHPLWWGPQSTQIVLYLSTPYFSGVVYEVEPGWPGDVYNFMRPIPYKILIHGVSGGDNQQRVLTTITGNSTTIVENYPPPSDPAPGGGGGWSIHKIDQTFSCPITIPDDIVGIWYEFVWEDFYDTSSEGFVNGPYAGPAYGGIYGEANGTGYALTPLVPGPPICTSNQTMTTVEQPFGWLMKLHA